MEKGKYGLWTSHVARENRVTTFVKLDAPVSFKSDIWEQFDFPSQEMRKEKI